MTATAKPVKKREVSRLIQDYSWKIAFPPKHSSAAHVLHCLSKHVQNNSTVWTGYETILVECGFSPASKRTVSDSIRFLRDVYHVITWDTGGRGDIPNVYTMSLPALKRVVQNQGIWNPAPEGKLRLLFKEALVARLAELAKYPSFGADGELLQATQDGADRPKNELLEAFSELPQTSGELLEAFSELPEATVTLSRSNSKQEQLQVKATLSKTVSANTSAGNPARLDVISPEGLPSTRDEVPSPRCAVPPPQTRTVCASLSPMRSVNAKPDEGPIVAAEDGYDYGPVPLPYYPEVKLYRGIMESEEIL